MLSKVFRYKGAVWRFLDLLTDILCLSLLWLVCSLPILTLGASCTALYDSVVRCIRFGQPHPYRRFFGTWKSELKVTVLSTLLWGVIALTGVFLLFSLRQLGSVSRSAAAAAAGWYIVLVIPVGAAFWAFPILSRFSFGFGSLNVTACKFALAHLPSTAVIVLIVLESVRLCTGYLFPVLFMPAVTMLLLSLFIEPVFDKHGGGIRKCSDEDPLPEHSRQDRQDQNERP